MTHKVLHCEVIAKVSDREASLQETIVAKQIQSHKLGAPSKLCYLDALPLPISTGVPQPTLDALDLKLQQYLDLYAGVEWLHTQRPRHQTL